MPTKKKSVTSPQIDCVAVMKELARRNISDKSIAARCGLTLTEFYDWLDLEDPPKSGKRPYRMVYEQAHACFEIDHAMAIEDIAQRTESDALAYKTHRDSLKELKQHAPASQAMSVETEDGKTATFVGFSIETIAGKAPAESDLSDDE